MCLWSDGLRFIECLFRLIHLLWRTNKVRVAHCWRPDYFPPKFKDLYARIIVIKREAKRRRCRRLLAGARVTQGLCPPSLVFGLRSSFGGRRLDSPTGGGGRKEGSSEGRKGRPRHPIPLPRSSRAPIPPSRRLPSASVRPPVYPRPLIRFLKLGVRSLVRQSRTRVEVSR